MTTRVQRLLYFNMALVGSEVLMLKMALVGSEVLKKQIKHDLYDLCDSEVLK
jgi:hypothetical protein